MEGCQGIGLSQRTISVLIPRPIHTAKRGAGHVLLAEHL